MWVEKTQKGHYKYVETYKCPYTGKVKRTSITYKKNTPAVKKQAFKHLQSKISRLTNTIENITYNEAKEIYLKSIEVKPSTLHQKSYVLSRMAKYFHNGDINMRLVTSAYIRDFYLRTDKYISRNDINVLKSFFNWCYKNDYTENRVFEKVTLKEQRHNPNYDKKFFEKEEMINILNLLDEETSYTGRVTRYVVEFITLTGLRYGEISALRFDDIEDDQINVTRNQYLGKECTPKTSRSIRSIAINSRATQIIAEMKLLKRIYGIESTLIFPGIKGNYILEESLKYYIKKAGIYPARLHIYRHTHASILAEHGIPLEAIQRRLGHEDDKVTREIYIHMTERLKDKENAIFKKLEIL